jgi:hypothetical protein
MTDTVDDALLQLFGVAGPAGGQPPAPEPSEEPDQPANGIEPPADENNNGEPGTEPSREEILRTINEIQTMLDELERQLQQMPS